MTSSTRPTIPVLGIPASGIPAVGIPAVGIPVAGRPVSGLPAAGLAVAALTAWILATTACGDPPTSSASDSDTGSTGSTGDTDATPTSGGPTSASSDDTGAPAQGEARYFLRIDDSPVPPVRLEMDKAKVLEVFGIEAAQKIKLLDVETTKLLGNVLVQIQNACGDTWDDAKWVPDSGDKDKDGDKLELIVKPPPPANCAAGNELGKSFGAAWKTSPEYAMVRLLSMTPGTVDVDGTSLQTTKEYLAVNPKVPFTLEGLLADSLGITISSGFIPLDQLTIALQQTLIASHPASTRIDPNDPDSPGDPAGKLPVTLYDAIMDMQPLAAKFSKSGDHPGILLPDDADFTTHSDALTPAFQMKAIADSNLRLVEGIDLSQGAGSMFISTAAAPLAFDFLDPEKVQMLGIADAPTVDMRMSISELPTYVASCETKDECKGNYPDTPVGNDHVWTTPAWSLERIIGTAGYLTYAERAYETCLINGLPPPKCDAGVWIGPNKIAAKPPSGTGGPVGWTQFKVLDYSVPGAQFLWEMFLGIAQVAIHDPAGDDDINKPQANKANNIAEGDAAPVYALKGVPIGISAEEMIAQIRPNLQDQAEYIANVILGKFWKHNARLDFYYHRAAPGSPPVLFFVGPDDPRPDDSGEALLGYSYDLDKVGFFADPALTDKLSSTQIDGVPEADHEKLRLPEGETVVYMQDDEQQRYRLRFYVPESSDPTEIVVHVHAL